DQELARRGVDRAAVGERDHRVEARARDVGERERDRAARPQPARAGRRDLLRAGGDEAGVGPVEAEDLERALAAERRERLAAGEGATATARPPLLVAAEVVDVGELDVAHVRAG